MSKEIAEKEGFVIGEKVLCFGVLMSRKLVSVGTIRDVKYSRDGETVMIFLEEHAGYYTLDEIYTKKRVLDMLC